MARYLIALPLLILSLCFNDGDARKIQNHKIALENVVAAPSPSAAINNAIHLKNEEAFNNDSDHIKGITPQHFHDSLQELLNMNSSTFLITAADLDKMLDSLEIGHLHEDGDVHDHDDHNLNENVEDHRDHNHDEHGQCFSMMDLLKIYGIVNNDTKIRDDQTDLDAITISYENLTNMFPAVIQQQLTKACKPEPANKTQQARPSITERYGYATLAIVVISIAPYFFIFIIPSTKNQSYRYVMNALIALSASTLVGDALLHLLPQALKLHAHDHGDAHQHEEGIEVPDYVLKMVVACAALYGFYLFGMLINGPHHADQVEEQGHGHGHSHMYPPDYGATKKAKQPLNQVKPPPITSNSSPPTVAVPGAHISRTSFSACELQDLVPGLDVMRSRAPTITLDVDREIFRERLPTGSSMRKKDNVHHEHHVIATPDNAPEVKADHEDNCLTSFLRELVPNKPLGWMVVCGDAIHNVIDGVAIGAAFSGDLVSGLSTSIAIVCHEIPHEVGDFAALLASGVSWRGGIVWNIIFSVLSLGGVFIGVSVADDDSVRLWVFALTAGMFIYVALTEMIPELTRVRGKFWYYFGFQNFGLLLGFGIMLVIAIFEERLAIAMAGSFSH